MKAWITLDRAAAPGGEELVLQQRGAELAIRAGGQVLMSSRATRSEHALAERACRGLRATAHVVVGGLGLGYTLRAALDALSSSARVVVAELVPAVVRWNRGPLRDLAGAPLDDPRVTVLEGDVRLAWSAPGGLDAILLDVDNGPRALTAEDNAGLYSQRGLLEARAALRPGGVLAVWSAAPAPEFLKRLGEAGFAAESETLPRSRHTLFFGRVGRGTPPWPSPSGEGTLAPSSGELRRGARSMKGRSSPPRSGRGQGRGTPPERLESRPRSGKGGAR